MAKKKVKPAESAISYSILALLVIIVAVIVSLQFKSPPNYAAAAQGPDGFKAFPIEEYGPANLYEKINGKAPLYVDAGFQKLTAQRFVNLADESLWFENYVYDMAENKNAFSVYSTQKRTGSEPVTDIGASQAYKTTNGLYFVKGQYYVEMIASAQSPELLSTAMQLAKEMQVAEEQNASNEKQLSETDLLQAENMVPDSIQLYRNEAFGFSGFGDLYIAKYNVADETITAFLGKCESPEKADQMAKSYHDFIIQNGGETKTAINNELQNSVLDFYGMCEIVASAEEVIVGVHEAQNQEAAEKLVMEIINKIKK